MGAYNNNVWGYVDALMTEHLQVDLGWLLKYHRRRFLLDSSLSKGDYTWIWEYFITGIPPLLTLDVEKRAQNALACGN